MSSSQMAGALVGGTLICLRLHPGVRDGGLGCGRLCGASSCRPCRDARARSRHVQSRVVPPCTQCWHRALIEWYGSLMLRGHIAALCTSSCHRVRLEQYSSLMLRGRIAAFGKCSRAHRQLVWVSEDDCRTPEHCATHLSRSRLGSSL